MYSAQNSSRFLLVNSGILDFGILNSAQGIRIPNSAKDCNPESTAGSPESKTLLEYLHRAIWIIYGKSINSQISEVS